jgi:hypothetical protein
MHFMPSIELGSGFRRNDGHFSIAAAERLLEALVLRISKGVIPAKAGIQHIMIFLNAFHAVY